MPVKKQQSSHFATLLNEIAVNEGIHPTVVEGVAVVRHTRSMPRTCVVYEPVIVFVAQGQKRSYLADQVFTYDPSSYFVLSVPLPAECEWDASPEEPILLVGIKVDPIMIGELLLSMDEPPTPLREMPQAVTMHPISSSITDALVRLLECLKSPLDSRILGRQIVREIMFRILCEEKAGALQGLANRHDHFMRIARIIKELHADSSKPFSVESHAKNAGMSVATLHHNFKLISGESPLQYLKKIRLDRAKRLMLYEGLNAGAAAEAVGYESASQFSREFKRQFGESPTENVERLRMVLDIKTE